jgi:peptide/nickel transport system ATP-binding protein
MYQGKIVEQGNSKVIFKNPKELYTKALINSKPSLDVRLKKLPTVEDYISDRINTEVYTDTEREETLEKIYNEEPILVVKNLKKYFISEKKWFSNQQSTVKAVDGVSFEIYEGETVGLVGESGCGKTTLGRTILGLEEVSDGEIVYKGKDISQLSKKEFKELRKEIQIIFQDPFSSLNPRIPVGKAILEPMIVHKILNSDTERKEYVFNLLDKVGLEKEHFYRYPHEFSGGQRQRIGIARTIALKPKLIICDESVSALDVSVQAQVLNLLNELKSEFDFTYIFISHDLSVVKYMSDQLLVMNNGQIEEKGDADAIYKNPKTAYTQKLIEAIPKGI